MSLTGGGFFGSGAKSQKTTSYSEVINTSTTFDGVDGTVVTGSGNAITLSDAGAVQTAERIATDAILAAEGIAESSIEGQLEAQRSGLEFSSRAIDTGFDLAKLGIDGQARAFTDALDFSERGRAGERMAFADSLASSAGLFGDSLAFANERTRAGLEFADRAADRGNVFASDVFTAALDAVGKSVSQGQATLGSTVTALNTIAREQSTSTDERVQAIASQALKVGGWVAAGIIGFAILRAWK